MENSSCLDTSIVIMTCSGIWLPKKLENSTKKAYYIALGVILQGILFFSVILAEMAHWIQVFGDTEKTVDATVLLLSHLVQAVKILTICLKQKRIKALVAAVDGPMFNPDDPLARGILQRTVHTLSLVGRVMAASAAVTAVFWCVMPQLKPVVTLPLKVYYPFNVDTMPMFGIMYAYLSISVAAVGVGDAAENYLVAAVLVLASAQLDVLTRKLHSLEPVELVTMVFYLVCVFMELLMYCYPGHLLISKSLLVADAWYSGWIQADFKTRRMIFLMVLRAQRALCVRAGGALHVSLPTAAARIVIPWYTTICLPDVIEELRKINRKLRIMLHHDIASSHTPKQTN
ncbi:Odorant receptor 45b [Eumeta japonica]|uniref:Odorant receptor n=1 Tax=Eumeta variegata TaxID=151549 RepID=A0A4C1YUR7_EUMVA|nr:Odorant receptor 45b [Eumeta japonica]